MIGETAIKLKLFLLFLSVIVNIAIGIFVYILISHILKLPEVNIIKEFLSVLRK